MVRIMPTHRCVAAADIFLIAQALATPVRFCKFTNTRVPNYFLLSYGLRRDPRSGNPWLLPQLELPPNSQTQCLAQSQCQSPGSTPLAASIALQDDLLPPSSNPVSDAKAVSAAQNPLGPSLNASSSPKPQFENLSALYFNSSYHVLACVSLRTSHPGNKLLGYLISRRWHEKLNHSILRRVVWRRDMEDFVLEILRAECIDLLIKASYKGKTKDRRAKERLVGCQDYGKIGDQEGVGSVMWMGPQEQSSVEKAAADQIDCVRETEPSSATQSPPSYATVLYQGKQITLYNIRSLLGEEQVRRLRASDELWQVLLVTVQEDKATLKLQMCLWKLMGYLAKSGS